MSWLKNRQSDFEDFAIDSWNRLESLDQIEVILKDSHEKPIVIFKHSTTCGTSARAKFLLEQDWNNLTHDIDFYYLDLWSFRPVSNAIAERLGVIHHSPQVIAIEKGEVIYHASHHMINVRTLNEALSQTVLQ